MIFPWVWYLFSVSKILPVIVTLIILIVYNCIVKNWWYFPNRNTKFIRGWPLIGSLHEFFLGKISFADAVVSFYRKFPNESFFGIYEYTQPFFVIRDPELVKKITVKDFEHFVNRQANFDDHLDSLISRSLFFSKDQRWKDMRSILSASFTGNKIRMMFDLVVESTNTFASTIRHRCEGLNQSRGMDQSDSTNQHEDTNGLDVELKEIFTRYMTNVIATTAFGLEIDSITDPENEFYLSGQKATNFNTIHGIKLLLLDIVPEMMKLLRIHFLDEGRCNYFRKIVLAAIEFREKNYFYRPDMIHLMIQAKKGTLKDDADVGEAKKFNFENDDLVAQCAGFFFAGFDTTSTLLCFMAHELACNPDIQQRLYEEIIEIEDQSNGNPVTYDKINNMKYMEMVVSETLRMWPPLPQINRQVTKPYRLEANGTVVELTTNDAIKVPVYALHMDPQYWEDPKRFNPERFNDENRKNIHTGTYLPFGIGQRMCTAPRFARLVAKTLFFQLLRELRIEKCDKTPNPVILTPNLIMHAKNGLWVRFVPRNSSNVK